MAERRAKGEGSLIRRAGCRFWYASFYNGAGCQVRVSTRQVVKQKALTELRRLMGKAERGEVVKDSKLTYGDIRAALISNYVEKNNRTLEVGTDGEKDIPGLRPLDEFCGYAPARDGKPGSPGIRVKKITTDFARGFATTRLADGVGNASVNRGLEYLRRMLRLAQEDGKISTVPKIRLLKEPAARKGFVDIEKFRELLNALPENLRPLILFLYWCGVRVGEALQIEWSQVNLERREIVIEAEQAKSGEARVIPLPDVLVEMLRPRLQKAGSVFDGKNLRTEWRQACAAVGLGTLEERKSANGWKWQKYDGLIIHDLRRSAIRNLRLAGVSETESMKISGHATPHVFKRYNIVSTEDIHNAMRKRETLAVPVTEAKKPAARISAKLVQNRRKALPAAKSKHQLNA